MHNWRELATQYGPLVWRVAYRVLQDHDEAADCHQDVFVDAIRRSNGRHIRNWAAFLHWLAVRRSLDRLRRRLPAAECHLLPVIADPAIDAEPGRSVDWEELLAIVRFELARIPGQQAEVFWLHCVEEFSLAEVAEQLELSPSQARVLLHRARIRLREVLRRKHPEFALEQSSAAVPPFLKVEHDVGES